MAKPENTAYQIMADFSNTVDDVFIVKTDDDIVALHPSSIMGFDGDSLRVNNLDKKARILHFDYPDKGAITFGFYKAMKLLNQCRKRAKIDFKKGQRPAFYLRKLTMSEFMAHPDFDKYAKLNTKIRQVFKRYMLLAQLRDTGF